EWQGRDNITKLLAALRTDDVPDLVDQQYFTISNAIVGNDQFIDLTDVLDQQIPGEELTVGDALTDKYDMFTTTDDGAQCLVPYAVIGYSSWYAAAAMPAVAQNPPTTWDDFAAVLAESKVPGATRSPWTATSPGTRSIGRPPPWFARSAPEVSTTSSPTKTQPAGTVRRPAKRSPRLPSSRRTTTSSRGTTAASSRRSRRSGRKARPTSSTWAAGRPPRPVSSPHRSSSTARSTSRPSAVTSRCRPASSASPFRSRPTKPRRRRSSSPTS